jgi:hypothetical protein
MSKEIDRRFHYIYREVNRCPKCRGLLEYCNQAGTMPPSIHCTACGWHDWNMKGSHNGPTRRDATQGAL